MLKVGLQSVAQLAQTERIDLQSVEMLLDELDPLLQCGDQRPWLRHTGHENENGVVERIWFDCEFEEWSRARRVAVENPNAQLRRVYISHECDDAWRRGEELYRLDRRL